jgi:hypothetical protein
MVSGNRLFGYPVVEDRNPSPYEMAFEMRMMFPEPMSRVEIQIGPGQESAFAKAMARAWGIDFCSDPTPREITGHRATESQLYGIPIVQNQYCAPSFGLVLEWVKLLPVPGPRIRFILNWSDGELKIT